ncbi:MAG: MliC family protein [Cyanobacteriota bacterium]|nr:MliC family protein [Cyanobacteriota bacterium]
MNAALANAAAHRSQGSFGQRRVRAMLGAAGAAAAIATALTPQPPHARAEEPIRVTYLCTGTFDASEVRALFFNAAPSEVILLTGTEGASRLLQQRAANGARYADGDEVFWVKGDQASWQRGKARALQCRTQSGLSSGSPAPTP